MNWFGQICRQVIEEAKASEGKINQAIDKHRLVVIRYNTHGDWIATANRLCGVFAYGTTKRGNPCIRVFEYQGDTSTFVPGWKLIRLDRIISWHETRQTVDAPPDVPGTGDFNPNGDNSMSMVYKVAKFGDTPVEVPTSNQPTTATNVKTGSTQKQTAQSQDTVKKMKDGLKPYIQSTEQTPSNEPKTAQDVKGNKERVGLGTKYADKPKMKTDTENAMDYLRRQLDNPEKIDLSKFNRQQPKKQTPYTATQNVQQAKPTAQQPLNRPGVGSQYANKPLRKTDTENAMDYLRKQLENPERLDLSRIPKR